MSVTDDERREVAEDMRKMASQSYPLTNPVLSCFIRAEKSDPASLWNRLADLIEPEPERTCRDVSRGGENFKCSECGTVVEVEHDDSLLYIGGLTDDFDYCPGCGAKVVEK